MRILLSLMLSILLFLQARLWLSDEGMHEVWRLESQIAERTIENHRLAIRNSALEGEVFNLKEGVEAAEERARTDLGMICLLYTSPSPRDGLLSRMPSSA